jgi:hypothetical protein
MQQSRHLSKWTFHGLNRVYEKMFERAGWMILERYVGHKKNISCYLNKIQNLRESIKEKARTTQNADRIQDLHAMFYNLGILYKVFSNLA